MLWTCNGDLGPNDTPPLAPIAQLTFDCNTIDGGDLWTNSPGAELTGSTCYKTA